MRKTTLFHDFFSLIITTYHATTTLWIYEYPYFTLYRSIIGLITADVSLLNIRFDDIGWLQRKNNRL